VYDVGPQGLNRYSYALNNPIMYRDPTGHFITGPNDDPNPTAYGNVTGSQGQIADGTATVHDGGDGTFTMPLHVYDEVGHAVFPIDLQEFFSPSPRRGWWKNVKQEAERFQRELAAKQYMINRTDAILTLQLFGESPRRDLEYYHLLKEEMEYIEKADRIAHIMTGVVIAGANVVNKYSAVRASNNTVLRNQQTGNDWDEYVASTKLRKLDEAGLLGRQERLPTPDIPGKEFVKPDYTIYNTKGTVAAYADAKSGAIAFDAQAKGLIKWSTVTESKTLIYYTPQPTTVPRSMIQYATNRGVTIKVITVR
jgi:hypothetical protein